MTGRLHIREYTIDNYDPYRDWQTDSDVAEYLSCLPVSDEEAYHNLVDAISQQSEDNRAGYFMAVVLNDTQEVMGNVGITRGKDTIGNIGWFLRLRFWGRGYATEATLLMIRYGFEIIGLKKLVGSCHRENKASERVMEKCKFYLTNEKAHRIYYALNYAN